MPKLRVDPLPLLLILLAAFCLTHFSIAQAHSPICYCYFEDDGSILCEGGFSDGASAEGVAIRILDDQEKVLISSQMDKEGLFNFQAPDVDFHVVFDAGDNHLVTIYMDEIE